MTKFFKKKGIVLGVLLLMVAGAIYINWNYSDNIDTTNISSQTPGKIEAVTTSEVEKAELTEQQQYLLTAKEDRDKTVSDSIAELKGIESNASLDEETRALAGKQHVQMYNNSVLESTVEELVIAKGYNDCAVVVNEDNITVIVIAEKLENSDTLQIIDIVKSQSDYSVDKIKIINI